MPEAGGRPMNDRLNESVAARLEALLARCDRIRLARDLDRPHIFNAEGERHAQQVAQRDQENN